MLSSSLLHWLFMIPSQLISPLLRFHHWISRLTYLYIMHLKANCYLLITRSFMQSFLFHLGTWQENASSHLYCSCSRAVGQWIPCLRTDFSVLPSFSRPYPKSSENSNQVIPVVAEGGILVFLTAFFISFKSFLTSVSWSIIPAFRCEMTAHVHLLK